MFDRFRIWRWKRNESQRNCPFCGGKFRVITTFLRYRTPENKENLFQEDIFEVHRELEFKCYDCKKKWRVKVPGRGFIETQWKDEEE